MGSAWLMDLLFEAAQALLRVGSACFHTETVAACSHTESIERVSMTKT